VWRASIPNSAELSSSLTYYIHIGRLTTQRVRVLLALLTELLEEPAFAVLRTKEQLGYMVSCTQWNLPGSYDGGIAILVQSERHPEFLEDRVNVFLDGMKSALEDMEPLLFEEHKVGLARKWREAPKNLSEETSRYWSQVQSGHLDFLRSECIVTFIPHQ
jgi:insulysin